MTKPTAFRFALLANVGHYFLVPRLIAFTQVPHRDQTLRKRVAVLAAAVFFGGRVGKVLVHCAHECYTCTIMLRRWRTTPVMGTLEAQLHVQVAHACLCHVDTCVCLVCVCVSVCLCVCVCARARARAWQPSMTHAEKCVLVYTCTRTRARTHRYVQSMLSLIDALCELYNPLRYSTAYSIIVRTWTLHRRHGRWPLLARVPHCSSCAQVTMTMAAAVNTVFV